MQLFKIAAQLQQFYAVLPFKRRKYFAVLYKVFYFGSLEGQQLPHVDKHIADIGRCFLVECRDAFDIFPDVAVKLSMKPRFAKSRKSYTLKLWAASGSRRKASK